MALGIFQEFSKCPKNFVIPLLEYFNEGCDFYEVLLVHGGDRVWIWCINYTWQYTVFKVTDWWLESWPSYRHTWSPVVVGQNRWLLCGFFIRNHELQLKYQFIVFDICSIQSVNKYTFQDLRNLSIDYCANFHKIYCYSAFEKVINLSL